MSEILIKDLPKKLRDRLARRAKTEGKTVEDYVLTVLAERAQTDELLEKIAKVRFKGKYPLTPKMLKKAKEHGRL